MRPTGIALLMLLATFIHPGVQHAQTLVNPGLTRGESARRLLSDVAPPSEPASRTQPEMAALAAGRVADARTEKVKKWMEAERFARQNPEAFANAVQFRLARPDLANQAGGEAALAAGLAALAEDPGRLQAEVAGLTDDQRKQVNADARSLQRLATAALGDLGSRVVVFADGNIRGALDQDESTDASSGTGALGVAVSTGAGQWAARINIASSEQVVSEDYGSIILAPGTGRSLASGLLELRMANWPVHLYTSVSNSRWKLGTADDAPTANATVLGVGALYTRTLASGSLDENEVVLTAEIGGAARWLDGDIHDLDEERQAVIGSTGSLFIGPEAGFTLALGRVTGQVQVYHLLEAGNAGRRIAGLNGLQVVAGLGVTGEMFRGRIR